MWNTTQSQRNQVTPDSAKKLMIACHTRTLSFEAQFVLDSACKVPECVLPLLVLFALLLTYATKTAIYITIQGLLCTAVITFCKRTCCTESC
jgi:hypothetical protein